MINVAIVDDNQINRKTIKDKLSPYKDINLMFEATNGEEFFEKLNFLKKENYPQVVLMDIEMPVLDGIAAIASGSINILKLNILYSPFMLMMIKFSKL